METPIEIIYAQYERFRGFKTKEEHENQFLAWFLTYKEQNLKQEKAVIIEAYNEGYENGIKLEPDRFYRHAIDIESQNTEQVQEFLLHVDQLVDRIVKKL